MKRCSFVLTPEEYKKVLAEGTVLGSGCKMDKMEGVNFVWAANPETIKKVLPPPLEMAAPLVVGYISNLDETNYGPSYNEAGVFIPVHYKGAPGAYFLSAVLDVNGAGTTMGAFLGRESCGMPKKIVDKIALNRVGDSVHAYVEHDGIRIIDVKIELGAYNAPEAQMIFGGIKPGAEMPGATYFTKVDVNPDESGALKFINARLLFQTMKAKYKEWLPGSAEITLQSHSNIPWAELAVGKVLGGGYGKYSWGGFSTKVAAELNADEVMPYILLNKYDIDMMDKENRKF
jgi:acetoacetate decarboxylase